MTRDTEFFKEIAHADILWRETTISCPVFYYDVTSLSAQFLASTRQVRASLPSPRIHPLRITPWHCVVLVAAFEYRDSDIGPYNEVSIAVPFTLDEPGPMLTGILRKPPSEPNLYIRHLPVTTEIARSAGVELGGYPKFLADITFAREGPTITCRLEESGRHILSLTGREEAPRSVPRERFYLMTTRAGFLLRCALVLSERSETNRPGTIQLELGDHPIAEEVRGWQLGRVLASTYAPQHQAILTPMFESFAV